MKLARPSDCALCNVTMQQQGEGHKVVEYHRARNLNPTAEGFHYHHMVKSIDIGWLKLWKRCSQKVRISPKGRVFLRIQVLSRFTERFQQKASEENSTKKSMLSERFLRSQPTSATLASSKSKIFLQYIYAFTGVYRGFQADWATENCPRDQMSPQNR